MVRILIFFSWTSKEVKGLLPTRFQLPAHRLQQSKSGGTYSNQILTPSKITIRISRPPTFEVHQSSPPKSILFPTSSRSSPLWGFLRSEDFISEPNNSNNSSPSIPTDGYATLFFSTFITCNATKASSYGQRRIFLHVIPTSQHNSSWPLQQIDMCSSYKDPVCTIYHHANNSVEYN